MEVRYSKKAQKAIAEMDKPTKIRIHAGIVGLTKKPPEGDIKLMQGFQDERMRLRIGKYRIIFRYIQETEIEILHIMNIGSRGDIYK